MDHSFSRFLPLTLGFLMVWYSGRFHVTLLPLLSIVYIGNVPFILSRKLGKVRRYFIRLVW